jgi:hypothetical protein
MCLEVYALLIIARDMIIYHVNCFAISTNVYDHVNCFQKLPKRLLDSCGIDPDEEGMAAGLRLTRTGSITSCAYAVDTDGRTVLSRAGWKKFLRAKNLRVGQAILLSVANTRRHDLRMMITIHLI